MFSILIQQIIEHLPHVKQGGSYLEVAALKNIYNSSVL